MKRRRQDKMTDEMMKWMKDVRRHQRMKMKVMPKDEEDT